LLDVVETGLDRGEFDLLLGVELTQLLFLFIQLLGRPTTLFSHYEVSISVVLNTSLLNSVNLDVFCPYVVLELGDLAVDVLNHLLACLEDLLLRVVV